jgi:hypothetical protein
MKAAAKKLYGVLNLQLQFLKKIKFEIKLVTIFYPGLVAWAIAQIILLGCGIYMSYEAYQSAAAHINKELLDNSTADIACQRNLISVTEEIAEAQRVSAHIDDIKARINAIEETIESNKKAANLAVDMADRGVFEDSNPYLAMKNTIQIYNKFMGSNSSLNSEKAGLLNSLNHAAVEPLVQQNNTLLANSALLKEQASKLLVEKQGLNSMPLIPQDKVSQGIMFKVPVIVGISVCVGVAIASMAGGSEPPTLA